MKENYWLCKRGQVFYLFDSETGRRTSLGTTDRNEAECLAKAKNETVGKPALGLALAKAYASAHDPMMPKRKWTDVIAEFCKRGKPQTQSCRRRITGYAPFDPIRNKLLLETTAEDFFNVLRGGGVMADAYLRCLHNLAQGLGWLPWAIIPPKLWPKVQTKPKRGITDVEHRRIIETEQNLERQIYYQLLWEVGAGQSDGANLKAENIDLTRQVLAYQRMKTGQWCYLSIGKSLAALLKQLPVAGPLFPKMSQLSDRDRAAEFRRRCRLLHINGVSLHSYRYAWAERAQAVGMPERFSQLALGHASKAVHRAYARNANAICPSLDQYERPALPGKPIEPHRNPSGGIGNSTAANDDCALQAVTGNEAVVSIFGW